MSIRFKILVDRIVGKPAGVFLNLFARVLAKGLRRNHALDKGFRRIAVCKFVGMGSIIQMTPLIRTLRESYPDARITFVTAETNRDLVERLGLVDEIIRIRDTGVFPLAATFVSALIRLWRFRAELYIDAEIFSNFSSILAVLSCAKNRIGFFKNNFEYRSGIFNYLVYFNMKAPVSSVFLQIARLAGCKTLNRDLKAPVILKEDRDALRAVLPFDPKAPFIVINPNASDLRVERRWDSRNFALLIEKIASAHPGHRMVLTGLKHETAYAAGIYHAVNAAARERLTDLSGRVSLGAFLALLESAALLVTNDTGPMHISFALERKTVTLWGPGHPLQYGDAKNSFSIYKNVYCSPCIYEFDVPPCKGDNQCMKAITVEEVASAVDAALANKIPGALLTGNTIYTRTDSGYPLGIVSH